MHIAEAMFDADVRVETMIWIPGLAVCEEDFPEVFADEFCESMPDEKDNILYVQLPILAKYASDDDYPEPMDIGETLRQTPGFLVQAATPYRRYLGDNGIFTSGWGHYHTAWLYAADEAQIAPLCVVWAEGRHESDRAKAAA